MEISEELREKNKASGKLGALATNALLTAEERQDSARHAAYGRAQKLSPKRRSEIARKAALARHKKPAM